MADSHHWLPFERFRHEAGFRAKCEGWYQYVNAQLAEGKHCDYSGLVAQSLSLGGYVAGLCRGILPAEEFEKLCKAVPRLKEAAKRTINLVLDVSEYLCEKLLSGHPMSEAEAEHIAKQVVFTHIYSTEEDAQGNGHLAVHVEFRKRPLYSLASSNNINQASRAQNPPLATDNESVFAPSVDQRVQSNDASDDQEPLSVLKLLQAELRDACGLRNKLLAQLEAAKKDATNDLSFEQLWWRAQLIVRKMILYFYRDSLNKAPRSEIHTKILRWNHPLNDEMKQDIGICGHVLAMMKPRSEGMLKYSRKWAENDKALNRIVQLTILEKQFKAAQTVVIRAFDPVLQELVRTGKTTAEEHKRIMDDNHARLHSG